MNELGKFDVLVNNAAYPRDRPGLDGISLNKNATARSHQRSRRCSISCAVTKGAMQKFIGGRRKKGICVGSIAFGPAWTPLIPSTMPAEEVKSVQWRV